MFLKLENLERTDADTCELHKEGLEPATFLLRGSKAASRPSVKPEEEEQQERALQKILPFKSQHISILLSICPG